MQFQLSNYPNTDNQESTVNEELELYQAPLCFDIKNKEDCTMDVLVDHSLHPTAMPHTS